jgi:hypothetical protein
LHHIDDEDFEDTAERAKKFKEALAEQEARDAEARQQNAKRGLLSGASLKKDDRKDKKESEEKEETDSPKDPKNETNGDAK